MTEENTMRKAMQAYLDAFNAGDLEAIVALYASNATVEDPVGTAPKNGHEEIRAFYAMALETGAKLKLSAPIRASHGNAAAMAFEVALNMPEGRSIIRVIDVMTFDNNGKYTSMKAYWGPDDVHPAD